MAFAAVYTSVMNTTATMRPTRRDPASHDRRARLKPARAFFIIAVLVALVSLAGHYLPGSDVSAVEPTPQARSAR